MLSPDQINSIVAYDSDTPSLNHLNEFYSSAAANTCQQHWGDVQTYLNTAENLASNTIRFRFAINAPRLNENDPAAIPIYDKDYYPVVLKRDRNFMRFIVSVIRHYYAHTVFMVNWTFSLCITHFLPVNNGADLLEHDNFVYPSPTNHLALETAHSVTDNASLARFFTLLGDFNIDEYLTESMIDISDKYDEAFAITVYSINLFLTRQNFLVYGQRLSGGIELPPGVVSLTSDEDEGMCLFLGLSTKYETFEDRIILRPKQVRNPDISVAKEIKRLFINYLVHENSDALRNIQRNGLRGNGLLYLEEFINVGFYFYESKTVTIKKVVNGSIVTPEKAEKKVVAEIMRKPANPFSDGMNFLVTTQENSQEEREYPLLRQGVQSHVDLIFTPKVFSKTFRCPQCNIGFQYLSYLKRHKCSHRKQRRFFENRLVTKKKSLAHLIDDCYVPLKFAKSSNFTPIFDNNFILITLLANVKNQILAVVQCDCPEVPKFHFEATCETMTDTVSLLQETLPKLAKTILESRQEKNISFKEGLIHAIEVLKEECNDPNVKLFETSELKSNVYKCKQLLQTVNDFESSVPVFILTSKNQPSIAQDFLRKTLSLEILSQDTKRPKIHYFFKNNIMQSVTTSGGLNFKLCSMITPFCVIENFLKENAYPMIRWVIEHFYQNFQVRLTNSISLTQSSNMYYNRALTYSEAQSLISPPADLFQRIRYNEARFGYILIGEKICHPDHPEWKSTVSLDFYKFYLTLLSEIKPFVGFAIKYERRGLYFEPCKSTSFHRSSFPNILFLTLAAVTNFDVHSAATGNEARIGRLSVRVDALLTKNHEKITVNYQGCYFHSCEKIHHKPNQFLPPDHKVRCQTCRFADRKGPETRLRPQLWKKSLKNPIIHPTKKIPYADVREETRRINDSITQSTLCSRHISIWECDIIRLWFEPLSKFAKEFDIAIKTEKEGLTLGEACQITADDHFPLLSCRKKLTMQTVIDYIKRGYLNGFVVLSGSLGPISQEIFRTFPPFATVNQRGKITGTFEITDQVLTTEFLSYLLNKADFSPVDFFVKNISLIYEYQKPTKPLFHQPAVNVLSILQQIKETPPVELKGTNWYNLLLKALSNNFIGSLSQDRTHFPKSLLMHEEDFFGLRHMKNFINTQEISEKFYISSFSNLTPNCNLIHLHYQILLKGKLEMLKLFAFFFHFLEIKCMSANTDGSLISGKTPLNEQNLPFFTRHRALLLDTFLKQGLSNRELDDYVDRKLTYIVNPSVCPDHESAYRRSLKSRTTFQPSPCCQSFENKTSTIRLNIEFIADFGLAIALNRNAIYNSFLKKRVTKCSGVFYSNFDRIENMTLEEMQDIVDVAGDKVSQTLASSDFEESFLEESILETDEDGLSCNSESETIPSSDEEAIYEDPDDLPKSPSKGLSWSQ